MAHRMWISALVYHFWEPLQYNLTLFVWARCHSGYWGCRKNQNQTTLCYSLGALAVMSVFSWDLFCLSAQQIDKRDQVCLRQVDKVSLVSHLGTPRMRKETHMLSISSHFIWKACLINSHGEKVTNCPASSSWGNWNKATLRGLTGAMSLALLAPRLHQVINYPQAWD